MAVVLLLLLVGSLVMGALTKNRNWLIPIGVFAMMFASKLADAPWWLYGVIIGVGLLAYAAAARRYHNRSARGPIIAAIVLAFIGLFGLVVDNALSVAQNVGGTQAQSQAAPGTGTDPGSCPTEFVQKWQNNPNYRVIDGGLYEDVTHHKITPVQADNKQRDVAASDVRALAGYAYREGLTDSPAYDNLLAPNKKCLSTQGIALYEKLTAKWSSGKVSIAQAPANAVNSGMENSALVVDTTSGITGDRTALERTYPDGSKTDTLARCGNPTFPGKPAKVPPGKTDQTPSPTPSTPTTPHTTPPTTTPPTHVCVPPKPYGTWPDCYGPKSPAPQPTGVEKPTNNPVQPVQTTPPPPKPTPLQPGGGGSTQTTTPANNNPGTPVTGAPTGAGPTSCVPPPGKSGC